MRVPDGAGNLCPSSTCVQVSSNVAVSAISQGGRIGPVIGPGHFFGLGGLPINVTPTQDYIPAGSAYTAQPAQAAVGLNVLDNPNFLTARGATDPTLGSAVGNCTLFSQWIVAENDASLFTFISNFTGSLGIGITPSTSIPASTTRTGQVAAGSNTSPFTFPVVPGEAFSLGGSVDIFLSSGSLPAGIVVAAEMTISWFSSASAFLGLSATSPATAVNTGFVALTPVSAIAPTSAAYAVVGLFFSVQNTTGSAVALTSASLSGNFQQVYCRRTPLLDSEVVEGVMGLVPVSITTGTGSARRLTAAGSKFAGGQTVESLSSASTALNGQGSIVNVGGTPTNTYSTTTTTLSITVPSATFQFGDGSTATAPSKTFSTFTGLSASTPYWFNIAYQVSTNSYVINVSNSGALYTSAPTGAHQVLDCYGDGLVAVLQNGTITTPASGTGGGSGGGGGGFACPAIHQMMETRESGFVRADELEVGMHLRDPFDGWNEIEALTTLPTTIWRLTTDSESIDVSDNHMVLTQDGWTLVTDLSAGAVLEPIKGLQASVVHSVERIGPGFYVGIQCKNHRYVIGESIGHNITIAH
jgi:hypothetical protein